MIKLLTECENLQSEWHHSKPFGFYSNFENHSYLQHFFEISQIFQKYSAIIVNQ